MNKALGLTRAFICYHICGLIGWFAHWFPRTKTSARIVNFLTAPFFGRAGYWAIRSNPAFKEIRDRMEGNRR